MNQSTAHADPQAWESHLQELHKQFFESANDRCIVWVNPAQGDPFEDSAFVQDHKIRVPISHPRFDLKFAPYLVPLHLSKFVEADLFKTSVQMAWEAWSLDSLQACRGQPIAGWIVADGDAKTLAQHWANNCHLHRQKSLTKLLRFHDPSVREWLWPTLNPIQKRQLLGTAKSIIAYSRDRRLMQQDVKQIEHAITPDETTSLSAALVLNAKQWSHVEDYAALHAAWLSQCAAHPEYRTTLEQQGTWVQSTLAALEQATQYGILDPQDRQLFATHALQLGGSFHTHPQLQSVWIKTRDGDFYGGALEEVLKHPADQLSAYLQNF